MERMSSFLGDVSFAAQQLHSRDPKPVLPGGGGSFLLGRGSKNPQAKSFLTVGYQGEDQVMKEKLAKKGVVVSSFDDDPDHVLNTLSRVRAKPFQKKIDQIHGDRGRRPVDQIHADRGRRGGSPRGGYVVPEMKHVKCEDGTRGQGAGSYVMASWGRGMRQRFAGGERHGGGITCFLSGTT